MTEDYQPHEALQNIEELISRVKLSLTKEDIGQWAASASIIDRVITSQTILKLINAAKVKSPFARIQLSRIDFLAKFSSKITPYYYPQRPDGTKTNNNQLRLLSDFHILNKGYLLMVGFKNHLEARMRDQGLADLYTIQYAGLQDQLDTVDFILYFLGTPVLAIDIFHDQPFGRSRNDRIERYPFHLKGVDSIPFIRVPIDEGIKVGILNHQIRLGRFDAAQEIINGLLSWGVTARDGNEIKIDIKTISALENLTRLVFEKNFEAAQTNFGEFSKRYSAK